MSANYTHQYGADGCLDYCSEARPWTGTDGRPLEFGECPHNLDEDGLPAIVGVYPSARIYQLAEEGGP